MIVSQRFVKGPVGLRFVTTCTLSTFGLHWYFVYIADVFFPLLMPKFGPRTE